MMDTPRHAANARELFMSQGPSLWITKREESRGMATILCIDFIYSVNDREEAKGQSVNQETT